MRLPAGPPPVLVAMFASLLAAGCGAEPADTSKFHLASREADDLAARIDSAVMDIVKASDDLARKHNRPPTPVVKQAADEDFLRRCCLDAIGRIPSAAEAGAFLADSDPSKRHRLIDKLLLSDEWADQWFLRLADMLRLKDEVLGASQQPYIGWARNAARADMPFDQLVLALLTASGDLHSNPASGYLLRDHGWLAATASLTATAFLGADLQCAACHDHPFRDHTQMQFHQWAACLGGMKIERTEPSNPGSARATLNSAARRLGGEPHPLSSQPKPLPENLLWPLPAGARTSARDMPLAPGEHLRISELDRAMVQLPLRYLYKDGKPGQIVHPAVPKLRSGETQPAFRTIHDPADSISTRQQWAGWIVRHPRFAKALGLRIWQQCFGFRGNGSWNSFGGSCSGGLNGEPYSAADAFSKFGCFASLSQPGAVDDLDAESGSPFHAALESAARAARFRVRELQRIIMRTEAYNRAAAAMPLGEFYPRPSPLIRRMSPDQIWDSLIHLAGGPEAFRDDTEKSRLAADMPQSLGLQHPLRILGRGAREWPDEDHAAITFDLVRWMFSSSLVERAAAQAARARPPVDEVFLAILSRPPAASELEAAGASLRNDPAGTAGIAWALLNTSEFLFVR